MSSEPVFLTADGIARARAELARLIREERPQIADRIAEAKSLGDISDNADYEVAKNDQSFLEGRIATLEQQLRNAKLITKSKSVEVILGSQVRLLDEAGEKLRFTIVGSTESKPGEGRISNVSPLGRALMGHRKGDVVEVRAPGGTENYRLLEVA